MFRVGVVGTAPLPGVEVAKDDIATPVQSVTSAELDRAGAADVSDYLARRSSGVHVNALQGNALQMDVSFRGFTASPLLGTPQGLSIFMDGVRQNQPFDDTVSWDLIPRVALSSVTLIPGSNPMFGLNTLGGALSLQTKDGREMRGTAASLSYGSHKNRILEFEHGGARRDDTLHWYVAGNLTADDGWREQSSSDVRQIFAKLGGQRGGAEWSIASAFANNELRGNGLQDVRLLDRAYDSVYTKPDITGNRAGSANLSAKSRTPGPWSWSANAYYRDLRTTTFNADANEDSLDQSVYQPSAAERVALAAAGYSGFPTSGATAANTPFPSWRCIANALLRDEPAEKCNGVLNRTALRQHNAGAAAQVTRTTAHDDLRNRFTVGAAFDYSRIAFTQSSELGYLNADRSVTGVGAFGDGVTGGNVDGEPYDTRVDLSGRIRTWSAYATDMISGGDRWTLTFSGRYNQTTIVNADRILPGGGTGSLDTDQVFRRLNPSIGLTVKPSASFNFYVGYGEGSRAPTSTELGCADPTTPCKLPNAMAGDPPLNAVVTRTFEAGLRSGAASETTWSINAFRADNRDDILFVSSGQSGLGYFANFGRTRRQGIDVSLERRFGAATFTANYTFLLATFESAEDVTGTGNSTNTEAQAGRKGLPGTIAITAGNEIPLIPRHNLKAGVSIDITSQLLMDLDVVAVSGVYARGNENNQHQPDGTYYLGAGRTDPFAVVDASARYRPVSRLELFLDVRNLFDHRYATAAQLGPTAFTAQGTFAARSLPAVGANFPVPQSTFLAPGAPRSLLFGSRVRF